MHEGVCLISHRDTHFGAVVKTRIEQPIDLPTAGELRPARDEQPNSTYIKYAAGSTVCRTHLLQGLSKVFYGKSRALVFDVMACILELG